jgi:hypothetical protein
MEINYLNDVYINIPDVYTNIDIDKPILRKIEINLDNNFNNYDIIINDNNKYNNIPIIDNVLFNFNSELLNCNPFSKCFTIHCKTNCNLLFYHIYYNYNQSVPIFDGFTNVVSLNDFIGIISNEDTLNACKNKNIYLLLYFYYINYRYSIYGDLYSAPYKTITYGNINRNNHNNMNCTTIDFLKYIIININKIDIGHIYKHYDDSIIYLDIITHTNYLEDTNNKNLSLMCVVNIDYDFSDCPIIIITPIKIIDTNIFYEIEIFNDECSKCSKCSKYKFNNYKYYSKFPFICEEHYTKLVKKMLHLFFNYTNNCQLYISNSNIISNLNKLNIDIDINNKSKFPPNYSMISFV